MNISTKFIEQAINIKEKQGLNFEQRQEIVKNHNLDPRHLLNDPMWMNMEEGVWTKHLLLDTHGNSYADLIYCTKSVDAALHYHHGSAYSFVVNGIYGNYKDSKKEKSGQSGSFIYSPAGSFHKPYMETENGYFLAFSVTNGAVLYLDNDYNLVKYSDVFTQLEKLKNHIRNNNLSKNEMDSIVK